MSKGPVRTVCAIGLGYVGLPTAALFALSGHQVIGVDTNPRTTAELSEGRTELAEAGLQTLVEAAFRSGRILPRPAPEPADVFIIAVPTPLGADGRADLRAIEQAAGALRPVLRPGNLVVLESTVPPRTTADRLRPLLERDGLRAGVDFDLVHCPERVLPGRILIELVENARVIGEVNPGAGERAKSLYQSFVHGEILITDSTTAEFVKLIENTYRDVNIALANELALIAEHIGIDVRDAIALANRHPRVQILQPGPGVGGHCIPIDPWFIVEAAGDLARLIPAARHLNDSVPRRIAERLDGRRLAGVPPVAALLGLAYKANVDDARESPAGTVAAHLEAAGWEVRIHDPLIFPERSLESVAAGAACLALLTDHDAYRQIDVPALARIVAEPYILDTRGTLDTRAWQKAGFQVERLGQVTRG